MINNNDDQSADLENVSLSVATLRSFDDPLDSDEENTYAVSNMVSNRPQGGCLFQSCEEPLYFLGGATEQILVSRIFCLLTATELSRLAMCSKYLARITSAQNLWINLQQIDFLIDDDVDAASINTAHFSQPSVSTLPTSITSTAKTAYIRRYREVHSRLVEKRAARLRFQNLALTNQQIQNMERFIDWTQVRLYFPVPLVATFLSMIFLALHYDGVSIPIWGCAAPVLFYFLYTMMCIVLSMTIFHRRHSPESVFFGMWDRLRSPVKFMVSEVCQESKSQIRFCLLAFAMSLLQVLLISVKLSDDTTPRPIRDNLEWGIVFLPMWVLLTMTCFSPVVGVVRDKALFMMIVVFIWIPLFIILVCLTVKLDGQDRHHRSGNMRLALLFMPLWIIEGAMMTFSSAFLAISVMRYRRGYLERIDEALALFFICWLFLSPFVIFQAMISAEDDHGTTQLVNHTKAVAALLVGLGVLLVAVIAGLARYSTAFEEGRQRRNQQLTGAAVIFDV